MKYKIKPVTLEITIALLVGAIAAITILIGFIDKYLMIPIAIIMLLAIISGFFIDRILLVWLVTIVVFVGIALILNIGSEVNNIVKILLLITFPLFATTSVLVRVKILSRNTLINNRKMIMRKIEKKDLITKTSTQSVLKKYYDKIVTQFTDQEPLVVMTLISLSYHEQLEYADQKQLFQVLSVMSKLLKENRLPSERIFYFGHSEFIIVSLRVPEEDVNALNVETRQRLSSTYVKLHGKKHELRYQLASLKLDQQNPIALDDVVKKLRRKQETDLIDEYLL